MTDDDRALIYRGYCPSCKRPILGWRPFLVSKGDRFFRFFRAREVDPLSGHGLFCPRKGMTHQELRKEALRG
jgi:hypothetical protein